MHDKDLINVDTWYRFTPIEPLENGVSHRIQKQRETSMDVEP
ncbi:MAG: hypothetical protein OXC61_07745 [Flavobacteriaceae bacterium]|nr:hypothetical protein [Flavobacteriaceae bacterium]